MAKARTAFNWPEEFSGIVQGYPVAAECASTGGCDNPVYYHTDYHSCNEELICEDHLAVWLLAIIQAMRDHGDVICQKCGETFANVEDIVTIRLA